MELRLRLDSCLDAELLERIQEKANGGSKNKALLFLVRHWFELETIPNLGNMSPKSGDIRDETGQNESVESDDLDQALEKIDDIFN